MILTRATFVSAVIQSSIISELYVSFFFPSSSKWFHLLKHFSFCVVFYMMDYDSRADVGGCLSRAIKSRVERCEEDSCGLDGDHVFSVLNCREGRRLGRLPPKTQTGGWSESCEVVGLGIICIFAAPTYSWPVSQYRQSLVEVDAGSWRIFFLFLSHPQHHSALLVCRASWDQLRNPCHLPFHPCRPYHPCHLLASPSPPWGSL